MSIAMNARPDWANPGVCTAIGRVATHLVASGASRVVVSGRFLVPPMIRVDVVDLDVWKVEDERTTERITMTGRLDKVDLRVRRFRVRDDVGNDVTLDDVVDVDAAAQLIGQRVVARGVAEREQGRVVRIIEPVLLREEFPAEWSAPLTSGVPTGGIITSEGIPGITDADVDEFLAELRG